MKEKFVLWVEAFHMNLAPSLNVLSLVDGGESVMMPSIFIEEKDPTWLA